MHAEGALDMGLIDEVLTRRKTANDGTEVKSS
jgi:ATP-dependent protease ClpP protease subunit